MVYQMKLLEKPFQAIKDGTKTIEYRLYDEKRRKLKIGDKIEFSKLPDLYEKITVEILDFYHAKNFKELFEKCMDSQLEVEEHIKTIYNIYSKEEEKQYGVIGIKIKVDDTD